MPFVFSLINESFNNQIQLINESMISLVSDSIAYGIVTDHHQLTIGYIADIIS